MKKRLLFLLSVFVVAAMVMALPVSAAAGLDGAVYTGAATQLSGEQDRSVFLSGQEVSSDAEVKGLALAAGYSVDVAGKSEYAIIAGYNSYLSGAVGRDAVAAGYATFLIGAVERDAYLAGNDVSVAGSVGRDLFAAGRNVTITGSIGGDVYISAESITLGSGAVIGGTLRYNSDATVTAADSSGIAATETYESSTATDAAAQSASENSGSGWWSKLCRYLGLVALALALLWLTPMWECIDRRYTGQPFGKYATAFGIGFGVLVGLPLAAAILMISGIGLCLAFVLLALYTAALLASPVFLGFFLGSLVWRGLIKRAPCYLAELPLGLLLWWLASLVPGLGVAVGLVCAPLGLGIVTLLLGKGKTATAPAAPAPISLPEETAEQ